MKKIETKYIQAAILLINILFIVMAINSSWTIFYKIAAIAALLTLLEFLFIKLRAKKSQLFENLKIQHGIIIIIIAAAFLILGYYKVNSVQNKASTHLSEQGTVDNQTDDFE